MDAISILIFGLATASNLAVIKLKLELYRYVDAMIDATMLVLLAYVFGSTITGLAIATIASSFFSLYLFVSSPDELVERVVGDDKKGKKKKAKKKRKKRKL
jgi:hypothetical protein